jgi:Phage integrase, N-terminal SAM-like domain
MTFQVIHEPKSGGARSPFHVVEKQSGREVEWANRFLDRECVRCLANTTLRSYAMDLLHFLRWWASVHHTDSIAENALASVLPDYVRYQAGQQPRPAPATVNRRLIVVGCALRNEFPDAACPPEPGFSNFYWLRSSLGCATSVLRGAGSA